MHWVHQEYWRPGPQGNDIQKTNVPNLRMRFRYDNLQVRHRATCAASLCTCPCYRICCWSSSHVLLSAAQQTSSSHCVYPQVHKCSVRGTRQAWQCAVPTPGLSHAGGADAGAQRRRGLRAPRRLGRTAQGGAGLMRAVILGFRVQGAVHQGACYAWPCCGT